MNAQRLSAAIEVTTRPAERIRASLAEDRELITLGYGAAPGSDALRALDAFVQRFQQMFEHMSSRLYPAIYRTAEARERPPIMRDLLTWLEGQRLIDSGRAWVERGEVRNRLVHEYPLNADDRAAAIRLAVEHSGAMLAEFPRALIFIEQKSLLKEIGDA